MLFFPFLSKVSFAPKFKDDALTRVKKHEKLGSAAKNLVILQN
jgi:hypothetical protein